jgi:quinol monooxygenase YgiN
MCRLVPFTLFFILLCGRDVMGQNGDFLARDPHVDARGAPGLNGSVIVVWVSNQTEKQQIVVNKFMETFSANALWVNVLNGTNTNYSDPRSDDIFAVIGEVSEDMTSLSSVACNSVTQLSVIRCGIYKAPRIDAHHAPVPVVLPSLSFLRSAAQRQDHIITIAFDYTTNSNATDNLLKKVVPFLAGDRAQRGNFIGNYLQGTSLTSPNNFMWFEEWANVQAWRAHATSKLERNFGVIHVSEAPEVVYTFRGIMALE